MLNDTFRRLIFIYSAVVGLIIIVFGGAIYLFSLHSVELLQERQLQAIVTSLTSSIEAPDEDDKAETIPDVVQSNEDGLAPDVSLQWFDTAGNRVAHKGKIASSLPFDKNVLQAEQSDPHALLATRVVQRKGQKLGYLRVIMSLASFDKCRADLASNLLIAGLLASLLGAFAVVYLVKQALKPVAQSIRRLIDFTADAAHELKTPITVIKTNGDVALKYPEGMRVTDGEKFRLIGSAATQMKNTVENLLVLAEADQIKGGGIGLAKPVLSLVELCPLIEEVLVDLAPLAKQYEVGVRFSSANPSAAIKGETAALKMMVANLVRNAIQYAGKEKMVTVALSASTSEVRITVEDKGAGILAEDLPRIFDRFWRSDKVRNYEKGGNGLGLSIVMAVASAHGGTVLAASTPGVKTILTVILPNKQ